MVRYTFLLGASISFRKVSFSRCRRRRRRRRRAADVFISRQMVSLVIHDIPPRAFLPASTPWDPPRPRRQEGREIDERLFIRGALEATERRRNELLLRDEVVYRDLQEFILQ